LIIKEDLQEQVVPEACWRRVESPHARRRRAVSAR
jgi:hypothetical protein